MVFNDLSHYGDKYTASAEAEFGSEFSVDDYAASVVDEFSRPFQLDRDEDDERDMPWNEGGTEWENKQERKWKKRGIWLRGNDRQFDDEGENRALALLWGRRRAQLAEHVYYCTKRAKSARKSFS